MPFLTLLAVLIAATSYAESDGGGSLRVMSYNIHHGEGMDGKLDVERIAALILKAKADLVGLQEVDRGVERTARRDLPAELAKLTGMHVHFERNITHQGGEYGNAVLTKHPIKRAKNTHLKMIGPGEQRGVLQLVLDVNGREVLFMNTHLDHRRDDAERVLSIEQAKEIIVGAGKMPVIFCGDFNATPESRPCALMKGLLLDVWAAVGRGNGFTIPAGQPAKRIDYIWVSQATIEPVKMEVLSSEASDHLPIVAGLRLK